ncbi:MAG: hypothetical protein V4682_01160 [Patescibacteria group bacterium]
MLRAICKDLGLDMRLRVGYVNSGGPEGAPAWISCPVPMPLYGTREFRSSLVTVYIRKDYLEQASFAMLVSTMAHEMCHAVLNGMRHVLRLQEEVVDLTAMILGYREFYLTSIEKVTVETMPPGLQAFMQRLNMASFSSFEVEYEERSFGYLTARELRYAASLMT